MLKVVKKLKFTGICVARDTGLSEYIGFLCRATREKKRLGRSYFFEKKSNQQTFAGLGQWP
jgi:hypothetical protein